MSTPTENHASDLHCHPHANTRAPLLVFSRFHQPYKIGGSTTAVQELVPKDNLTHIPLVWRPGHERRTAHLSVVEGCVSTTEVQTAIN